MNITGSLPASALSTPPRSGAPVPLTDNHPSSEARPLRAEATPSDCAVISAAAPVTASSSSATAGALAATQSSGRTGLGAALHSVVGAAGAAILHTVNGLELAGSGLLYEGQTKLTGLWHHLDAPLSKLPTPSIERPFVLVPGFTTGPKSFADLRGLLNRDGANGGQTYFVKCGKFYTLGGDGQLQPLEGPPKQGKVFEMVWTDTHQSPDRNLPEMRENLDAICQATGYDKVDAEGYSMGGLDSRLYLDQGGTQIHKLLMLGTPNHGTGFGEHASIMLDRGENWATKFAHVSNSDDESLQWLREEKNSPKLQALNSTWERQRAQVDDVLSLGANRAVTASATHFFGLAWGDGLVPESSTPLPGTKSLDFHEALSHGLLNNDTKAQDARCAFFGWTVPADTAQKDPEFARVSQEVQNAKLS